MHLNVHCACVSMMMMIFTYSSPPRQMANKTQCQCHDDVDRSPQLLLCPNRVALLSEGFLNSLKHTRTYHENDGIRETFSVQYMCMAFLVSGQSCARARCNGPENTPQSMLYPHMHRIENCVCGSGPSVWLCDIGQVAGCVRKGRI